MSMEPPPPQPNQASLSISTTPSPQPPPRSQASGRSVTRTRTGCLTCRRRKVRCDQSQAQGPAEARTTCENCVRLKLDCQYDPPGARRRAPRRSCKGQAVADSTNIRNEQHVLASVGLSSCLGSVDVTYASTAPVSASPNSLPHHADTATPMMPPTADYPMTEPSHYAADPMHFDRGLADDMTGLPTFPDDTSWQPDFAFPHDILTPINGLYSSSLLPWKELPQTDDPLLSTMNIFSDSHNQDLSQSIVRPRSVMPQASFHSAPPAAASPHMHPRRQKSTAPKPCESLGNVDIALFDVTERQRQLLKNFNPKANPIPLITPANLQWRSAYSSLISLSYGCSHLINSICSVSELNLVPSKKGSVARAFQYYQNAAAKTKAVLQLPGHRVDDRSLKQAFAALFLLMHAEIMAQPLANHQSWPIQYLRSAYHYLKRHHERLRPWSGIGGNILSWIRIVDSKAIYAAGMEKETDRSSQDSYWQAPSSSGGTRTNLGSTPPDSPVPSDPAISPGHVPVAPPDPHFATVCDDSVGSPLDEPLSAAEIAYDALYQPAYQFFMQCQCFIPRIIALDTHHRPRGPLDAELEVLQLGQRLRTELRDMWIKRPTSLGVLADTEGLQEVLHPKVARKIIQSFRSFVANFHAIHILLHRVAFIHYPASDEVMYAIREILRLAREQIAERKENSEKDSSDSSEGTDGDGCDNSVHEDAQTETWSNPRNLDMAESSTGGNERPITQVVDGGTRNRDGATNGSVANGNQVNTSTTAGELSHAMLWLWPLFMCGTECSVEERQWVLDRMYAMKSMNADRTALLLTHVTKQQDETKQRVDQRSVRQKIFADEFDLVY